VPAAGYAWWSIDAESDDGQHRIHVSAALGAPFAAARTGVQAPEASLHVALYGPSDRFLHQVERPGRIDRGAGHLNVGASRLRWERGDLVIDLAQRRRVGRQLLRGRITLSMPSQTRESRVLDPGGVHNWWPVCAGARVRVELDQPRVSWRGAAVHQVRWGQEPPVRVFHRWTALHTLHADGALVHCGTEQRDGVRQATSVLISADGAVTPLLAPEGTSLGTTRWGLRPACNGTVMASQILEDTPYFVRSRLVLKTPEGPRAATLEHYDLARWQQRWVQALLPWRPRWQP
jgi:carotenoid 1,2-hydratase